MRDSKKKLVEILLKKSRDGVTVSEIARELGISRNTAAVALAEFNGKGLLKIREAGMAKIHYWRGK